MTSGERIIKNVIEGINKGFSDLTIACGHQNTLSPTTPILVRALDRYAIAGQGVQMGNSNGFSLTIGDRTVHFTGEGRYDATVKAPIERSTADWKKIQVDKPKQYAAYCRSEITEAELFATTEEPVKLTSGETMPGPTLTTTGGKK